MDQRTIRQLRGASDLVGETVAATVTLVAQTHRTMARQPYALLSQIPVIGRPARLIEQFQNSIMEQVYSSILSVNHLASTISTAACDHLEQRASRSEVENP